MRVSEHLIRLRAGWMGEFADGRRRVALPLTVGPDRAWPIRLTRQFHAPRVDPARERLGVLLEAVDGLLDVRLDGRSLGRVAPGATNLELPIDPAPPPGRLVELALALDPDRRPTDPGAFQDGAWGCIALVIAARSDQA